MNTFTKSHWVADGNRLSLSMPLTKVDQENRLVSGFATLDNVDSQGDVVLAEASKEAFARARGNIREMHQPIAVGKVVDFREEEFYHDGEFYRGIYVTAYVSKGSESTWEKVLDGTLTGFSIGGNIVDASNEFVKEQGKSVRFIKSYDLVELSLVDNPANQLANVFSITKAADGHTMVKGMVADVEVENVFYCATDEIFKSVAEESANCTNCGNEMKNIGWVETGSDRAEKVRDVVTKFLGSNAANNEGEGGVENMGIRKATDAEDKGVVTSAAVTEGSDEAKTPLEELKEEAASDNVEAPADEDEQKAEALEEVDHSDETTEPDAHDLGKEAEEAAQGIDETPDADEEISKKIDSLKDAVTASIEKTRNETSEAVAALEKKLEENAQSFLSKVSDLESKFSEFGDELKTAKASVASLEKSLEAYNNEGSFKKSGDVGDDEKPEPVQKANAWSGAFSIDNLLK
jgi:hypothetical protein